MLSSNSALTYFKRLGLTSRLVRIESTAISAHCLLKVRTKSHIRNIAEQLCDECCEYAFPVLKPDIGGRCDKHLNRISDERMDSIDVEQYSRFSYSASCFAVTNTPKGKKYFLLVWAAVLTLLLLHFWPYQWNLDSLYAVSFITAGVTIFFLIFLISLPLGAVTGYSGVHTYRTVGHRSNKIFRYTINSENKTLEIVHEKDELTIHPVNELKIHKKMGDIFLVHENTVHMLPWTPKCLSFVKTLELRKKNWLEPQKD